MTVLTLGLGLFFIAIAAHIALWRHRPPARSGQTLMLLMTGVIGGGWVFAIAATQAWAFAAQALPTDAGAWLQTLVLALALAAAYVMTYPAIEVESPTLVIIEIIAKRRTQGIDAAELHRRLDAEFLVAPRLQELLNEGLAVLENGRYRPTPKGRKLARLFTAWQHLTRGGLGG